MGLDITGLGSLLDFAGKIIDKVWPDPTAAAQAKLDLFKAEQAGQLQELQNQWDNAKSQLEVNKQEAASVNIFVAGWRPFIGWVCGVAFAYKFVVGPILAFIMVVSGHPITLPELPMEDMMTVLMGMLGLGAMRSYDKLKGTSPSSHG